MLFKISINFADLINVDSVADQSSWLVWLILVGRDGPFCLIWVVFLIFSIIIYKIDPFSVPDVSIIEIGGGRSVSAASMGHFGQSGWPFFGLKFFKNINNMFLIMNWSRKQFGLHMKVCSEGLYINKWRRWTGHYGTHGW